MIDQLVLCQIKYLSSRKESKQSKIVQILKLGQGLFHHNFTAVEIKYTPHSKMHNIQGLNIFFIMRSSELYTVHIGEVYMKNMDLLLRHIAKMKNICGY